MMMEVDLQGNDFWVILKGIKEYSGKEEEEHDGDVEDDKEGDEAEGRWRRRL